MKITNIRINGLKNRTGQYALESIHAFTGKNRSGKTTVRDAVLLALTGKHPDLPATNQGIIQLTQESRLAVGADIDGLGTVERSWTRAKGGSVKKDETFSNSPLEAALIGLNFTALVPDEFFAMKGTERVAFLSALADTDAMRAILEKAADNDPELEDIIDSDDPHKALRQFEKIATDRRKAAKQDYDRLKKALQESLKYEAPATPFTEPGSLALATEEADRAVWDAQKNAKAARDRHNTILESLESAAVGEGQLEQLKKLRDRVTELKHQADAAASQAAELEKQEQNAASMADSRASLRRGIDEAEGDILDSETRGHLQEAVNAYDGDITTAKQQDAQALQQRLSVAEVELKAAHQASSRISQQIDAHEKTTEDFLERDCCPTCGTAGADFHEAYRALAEEKQRELQKQFEAGDEILLSLERECTDVREALGKTQEHNARIAAAANAAAILEAERKAHARLENLRQGLENTPEPLSTEHRQFLSAHRATVAELKATREKLEAMREEPATTGKAAYTETDLADAVEAIEKADAATDAATEERGKLREHEQAQKAADAAAEQTKRLSAELDEAEDTKQKAEKAVTDIRNTKAEIMDRTWGPIQKVADRILTATFGTGVTAGVDDDDIGLTDDAGYRPFATLSGSEKAVLSFALSIALSSIDTKAPGIALIDELNRMDPDTRANFLNAAQALVGDKTIDQILIFDHDEIASIAAGIPITEIA